MSVSEPSTSKDTTQSQKFEIELMDQLRQQCFDQINEETPSPQGSKKESLGLNDSGTLSPHQSSGQDAPASLHPSASKMFEAKMNTDADLLSRSNESQITITQANIHDTSQDGQLTNRTNRTAVKSDISIGQNKSIQILEYQ